jgi:hypothetical protein
MSADESAASSPPNFCTECGSRITGTGKFCSNCGTPSGVHAAITPAMMLAAKGSNGGTVSNESDLPALGVLVDDDTAPITVTQAAPVTPASTSEDPPAPPASTRPAAAGSSRPGGVRRGLLVGVAVAALVVVAVIVVVIATSGGDTSSKKSAVANVDRAYQQKVATAFGPLLGANQQLSSALTALHGTDPAEAKLALAQAQKATTTAAGALGALSAPSSSSKLAGEAQQVIDRETAYLAAVANVLNHPSVTAASQLQTLSSNLISAFDSAGPVVAGSTPTVSGADRLTSWAHSTSATLRKRAAAAKKKAAARRKREARSAGSSSSSSASSPLSGGTSCGGGLWAGPNTSCGFAENVREAYDEAPGASATVRAFSPATGETYTMSCRPSGSGVTCSGANDASVAF